MRLGWVAAALALAFGAGEARADEPKVFQPGFHQALRQSWDTPGRVTYRLKLPIGRAGDRIQITLRAAGNGADLFALTVAPAASVGRLAGPPTALLFQGQAGVHLPAGQRVTSDPVALSVDFGEELAVSLDVRGTLAASGIAAFPGSFVFPQGQAAVSAPGGGKPFARAAGVDDVQVEASADRVFLVVGDSISEGYVEGSDARPDDVRNSWPFVAQSTLGLPVVNSAVSAQGVSDALVHLDTEVLAVPGITDCIVLLGTNNLGNTPREEIESQLNTLFSRLAEHCKLWASPLLPKDLFRDVDANAALADRAAVNTWIATVLPAEQVVHLETVLADATHPEHFAPGASVDGIHPTVAGQHTMGVAAASRLEGLALISLTPAFGGVGGGDWVVLSGHGFVPGVSVLFGTTPALALMRQNDSLLSARTPAHDTGAVDVTVESPLGEKQTTAHAFRFGPPGVPGVHDVDAPLHVGGCTAGGLGSAWPWVATAILHGLLRRRRPTIC